MIKLVVNLPTVAAASAELIKIKCTFEAYNDTAMFWVQDENRAIISMLDGNMTVYNADADITELREFIRVIAPATVFSDAATLSSLFGSGFERVRVLGRIADGKHTPSDKLSSLEIYRLLDVEGLELPPYEYFAVDYCHRINHGLADSFALRDKCAAVVLKTGEFCLLNGIASHQKGAGSVALSALMHKNRGKHMLCCCRDNVMGFYIKNKFKHLYDAGYRRKSN